MSTKKLVFLVLLVGALVVLYRMGAPAAAERPADDAGWRATLTAVPVRIGHGVGVVSARIVAPAVRNMVADTERDLQLLRAELKTVKNVPSGQLARMHEGVRQVAGMDSTALGHLAAGRPILSFKLAMQANGLVVAMRGNIRGDR